MENLHNLIRSTSEGGQGVAARQSPLLPAGSCITQDEGRKLGHRKEMNSKEGLTPGPEAAVSARREFTLPMLVDKMWKLEKSEVLESLQKIDHKLGIPRTIDQTKSTRQEGLRKQLAEAAKTQEMLSQCKGRLQESLFTLESSGDDVGTFKSCAQLSQCRAQATQLSKSSLNYTSRQAWQRSNKVQRGLIATITKAVVDISKAMAALGKQQLLNW